MSQSALTGDVQRLKAARAARYALACLPGVIAVPVQYWLEPWTGRLSDPVLVGAVALTLLVLLGLLVAWLAGERRGAQEEVAAALTSIGEGVVLTDRNGRVRLLNPAAEALSGWRQKEARGRPFQEVVRLASQGSGGPLEDPVGKAIGTGATIRIAGRALARSRAGAGRPVEGSATPIRDGADRLKSVIVVLRDISARGALEQQLRHAQKIEALATLASGIARDFKNCLTAVAGRAELLKSRLPSGSDPLLLEDANQILRASERAAELSRELLIFGGRQATEPRLLNLNDILRDLESLLRKPAADPVRLTLELAPDLRPVRADAGQIQHAVMNLAINAREAMPDGGTLSIRTRNTCLDAPVSNRLTDLKPGAYVELEVTDTGCGMDESVRSKIFRPFFTTKRQGEGAGVGLSIVSGIVKQWGGGIEVSSRPGEGSTFRIYLPSAGERRPETAGGQMGKAGAATILVAEQDAGVRKMMCSVLREEGFTVLETSDGAEAARLAAADINRIDLIVAAADMPLMGRPELLGRLRLLRPELNVLYLGGAGAAADRDPRLATNVGFLSKPFTATSFLSEVQRLLSGGEKCRPDMRTPIGPVEHPQE